MFHTSATAEVANTMTARRLQSSRSLLRQTVSRNSIVNVLKNHIKEVLNIELTDRQADQYIVNSFRVDNPDPMYVFVLPDDRRNETVYFRRTDFTEAVFPNVSTLQKIRKMMVDSKLMPEIGKGRRESRVVDEKFMRNFERFKSNSTEFDEAEHMKVVEENVRTEKNFFKFMDELNSLEVAPSSANVSLAIGERSIPHFEHQVGDYKELLKHVHSHAHLSDWKLGGSHWDTRTTKRPSPPKKLSWEDLGLHGWRGEIIPQKGDQHANK